MEWIPFVIIAGMIVCLTIAGGYCAWGIAASEITYRRGMRLLDVVHEDASTRLEFDDWRRGYDAMERVTYDAHMQAVMRFQDPWKLYPPFLRSLLEPTHGRAPVAETAEG